MMLASPAAPRDRSRSSLLAADVCIRQHSWHSRGNGEWRAFQAAGPTLLVVSGGPATVMRGHDARSLLDPAQALMLGTGDVVQLRGIAEDAGACTVYLISTTNRTDREPLGDAGAAGAAARGADFEHEYLSLGSSALFHFHRLQQLLRLGARVDPECIASHALGFVATAAAASARCTRADGSPRTRARSAARRRIADGARELMAAAPGAPHDLAGLARALCTTPFHLAHVFRDEVGTSPHRYLVWLRLVAALRRLGRGASDLSQIAYELGFANHSHFSASFRRAFGVTPREGRRLLMGTARGTANAAWSHAPAPSAVALP